jgi:hypothetical protein
MSKWGMTARPAQAGKGRDRQKVGRKIGLKVSFSPQKSKLLSIS